MESAISIKGQATIPKRVRDYLSLVPSDRVKFFMHPDGSVVMLPKRPMSSIKGILPSTVGPVSIDEMDEAVAEAVAEDYERGIRS